MCATSSNKKSVHISDLTIKGYRGFGEITIPQLGRVNLFTGKNNTGKSSLLEAVRLLAGNGSLRIVYDILESREEEVKGSNGHDQSVDQDDLLQVASLFNGFPSFSDDHPPIHISASHDSRPLSLKVDMDWVAVEEDSDGNRQLVSRSDALFSESDLIPALWVEAGGKRRFQRLDNLRYIGLRRATGSVGSLMPCEFVSPYGGEGTEVLDGLWSRISLTDREQDVIETLRIIEPGISGVSMVSSDESRVRRSRTAIVRAENIPRPVPLRSFGDGLNRLFGIVLSLVNVPGGVLLIDEFENGLHYSVQLNAWRMIFRLAHDLDVQVFATTHSEDAVEAFSKAASESPEDGVFVRLARRRGKIITTMLVEDDLTMLVEVGREVR